MTIETIPVRPQGSRWASLVGLIAALTVGLALYGRLTWVPPTSPTATASRSIASPPPPRSAESSGPGGSDPMKPLVASVALGSSPVDLAYGFGSVWVADLGGESIASLSPQTGQLMRRLEIGGGPAALAIGEGSLWVAQAQTGTVVRIEPGSGRQLASIRLGSTPVAVAAGAGAVWVTTEDDAVLRIDVATNRVVAALQVPSRPRSLVVARGSVWVASRWAGRVVQIDPATMSINASLSVRGADRIVAGSDALWVIDALSCGLGMCDRNGQLFRLDPTTGTLVEGAANVGLVTPAGGGPWAIVLGPNRLLRLDPETGLPIERFALGLGLLPTALLETPGALWIADAAHGRVVEIATASEP